MTSSHKTPVIPRSQSGEAELVELWGIPRRSFANENCLITLLSFAVSTEMASNEHSGYPLKWFKDQNTVRNSYECAICLGVCWKTPYSCVVVDINFVLCVLTIFWSKSILPWFNCALILILAAQLKQMLYLSTSLIGEKMVGKEPGIIIIMKRSLTENIYLSRAFGYQTTRNHINRFCCCQYRF